MKKFTILICVSILVNFTKAQLPAPTQGLLSPNAASIGKYGDFDVSYYTGAVDVSIPLYNFSANGIDLPITLRYDASGVRVNALPSWVGQNWTLLAGGAITRIARGPEDEYRFAHEYGYEEGNTYNQNYFSSYNVINQIATNPNALNTITNVGDTRFDFQPDIFIFNFMGISGKFFLGNDGNWEVESDFNIDIIFDFTNEENFDHPFIEYCACRSIGASPVKQSKSIKGFRLRDGDGNTYTFGYNKNAIEYYIDMQYQVGWQYNRPSWRPNCWYLTEVSDRFSNIVYNLEYQRKYHIAHLYPRCQRTIYSEEGSANFWESLVGIGAGGGGSDYFGTSSFSGDLISPVYLKSIEDVINSRKATFNISVDDDISFENSSEFSFYYHFTKFFAPYLTGICERNISNGTNEYSDIWDTIKQYVYNYQTILLNPYNAAQGLKKMKLDNIGISNTNGDDIQFFRYFSFLYDDNILNKGRIFLTKITEEGKQAMGGSFVPITGGVYNFSYRTNTSFPDYMSYKTDHWGYYNGTSIIPYCTLDGIKESVAIYSAKETNSTFVQNGLLDTIIYPSKGKSIFQYERHDYSKVLADDGQSVYDEIGLAGGVRIKQISNYNDNGSLINQRNFYYSETKNGTSSGQLSAKPKYHWKWTTNGVSNNYSITTETYQITTVIPLSNSFGSHIGYSCVIEEELQNGYTKYKYDNFSEIKDDLPVYSYTETKPSLYDKRSEKTSMLGRIRKQEIYNANNQLVRETNYNYDNINTTKFVYSSNVEYHFVQSSANYVFRTGDIYKLYYNKHFLSEEITKEYLPNAVTTSITYTKTDSEITTTGRPVNVRVLSSKQITNSDLSILKEQYTYPFQLTSNNLNSNIMFTTLKNKFIINQPTETKTFYNGQIIDYKSVEYGISYNFITPIALWTSKNSTSNLVEETRLSNFNNLGQASRITNCTTANLEIIWGGRKNELMLAIVENPPANINLTNQLSPAIISFQNGSANNTTALIEAFDNLRNEYPYSRITSYTYLFEGIISSVTDSRGITTYYNYDDLGRLKRIKLLDDILKEFEYHYK